MDIQKIANEVIAKLQKDPTLLTNFSKNPIGTVEKLLGIDLPDDQIKAVAEAVKAQIGKEGMEATAKTILNGLGGLFGK